MRQLQFCYQCLHMHPDEMNFKEVLSKFTEPERHTLKTYKQIKEKAALYKNATCGNCGRSYDQNSNEDKTWGITTKLVRMELENAGLGGSNLDDTQLRNIVTQCYGSWLFLMRNRDKIRPEQWEYFTFRGRLAMLITKMQQGQSIQAVFNK